MGANPRAAPSFSPNGIPFWPQREGYRESFARDENLIESVIRTAWSDGAELKEEFLGFTTWVEASPTFQRRLPYVIPYSNFMACEKMESTGYGEGNPDGTPGGPGHTGEPLADPEYDGFPTFGYIKYQCLYRRKKYALVTDASTTTELQRYVTCSWEETAREQAVGPLMLYNAVNNQPTNSKAFRADHTYTGLCTWWEVPIDAVPWSTIGDATNMVNSVTIVLPFGDTGTIATCVPQSLLFKSLAGKIEPYSMANGELAVDLPYLFEYRPTRPFAAGDTFANPFGHNGIFDPQSLAFIPVAWGNMKVNPPVASDIPFYGLYDLRQLFNPAAG